MLGIALEGVYAAGLPLDDVFDTSVFRDVLDTRYGQVALVRLALLVLAIPLLRLLLHRRPATEHPLRVVVDGAGARDRRRASRSRPGIAGHASSGIQTGLAIPADLVHVAGMACWLGGLVVLCVAVLPRRDVDELRAVLPRYSALALGAIVALVVSGAYQAWRQVGSIDALKSTDYGRLLIAKLVVFAALIVAAAFSREIVNRRFRDAAARRRRVRARRGSRARRRAGAGGQRRMPAARRPTGERRRLRRVPSDDGRLGRRRRGPGGDDAPAPLGVGRGRHRRGHPGHHRAAGERGAGALGDDAVRSRSR